MAIIFPQNPTPGQVYLPQSSSIGYTWTGQFWDKGVVAYSSTGSMQFMVSYVAATNVSGTVHTSTTASYITASGVSGIVAQAYTASYIKNAETASQTATIDVNQFSSDYDSLVLLSNVNAKTGVSIGAGDNLKYNTSQNKLTVGAIVATSITGSLIGTATTASYVQTAETASYVITSLTASYVNTARTASYVVQALTASYVELPTTYSQSYTASYVTTAQTASYVTLAQTASYTLNAGGGSGASVTVGTTAPASTSTSGTLWWDSTDGNLYIQVSAPTGSSWVPATTTVANGYFESGSWNATEATTITAITTNPTKPTTRLYDRTRYRLSGIKSAQVELDFAVLNLAGSAAGNGQYLFKLPTGISFDTSYHNLDTSNNSNMASNSVTNTNIAYSIGIIGYALVTSIQDMPTQFAIVPYTSTTYRVIYNWGTAENSWVSSTLLPLSDVTKYYWKFDITIA